MYLPVLFVFGCRTKNNFRLKLIQLMYMNRIDDINPQLEKMTLNKSLRPTSDDVAETTVAPEVKILEVLLPLVTSFAKLK